VGTRPPSLGAILVAVLFALSCFGATLFVWRSFGGPTPLHPKGYRFLVSFDQAATLTPNADVRIAGVPVGKVIKVTPSGLRTEAVIELERDYAPIPSDARVILRTKTLLGEAFVELTPGSPNAPKLREDGRLPARQVGETQQLDQVLSAFDSPTRKAFKRFLVDLSASLDERGEDMSSALGNLGPATDDLGSLLLILDRQQDAVTRLIRDGGRVLRAVGRQEGNVQTLVTAGEQVFSATAARNAELTATVRALPPFLAELRRSLAVADRVAVDAAPTLRALRPVAPLLRPGLVEASRLAPELERLFRGVRPVQRAARTGLPAAVRIVKSAGPLMGVIHPAARELVPVIDYLGRYTSDIVASFANVGASTQASTPGPDGPLHYLRTIIPLVNEGYYGFSHREPSNRHNPYTSPNALENHLHGGLRAFDCRNLSNPANFPPPPPSTGPPPCLVQPPWTFRGVTRAFPHVERTPP
jgi:phospholipid/cholesterol/gamma-HCH transport system substrate-binding protein